ncbi:MAG: hypothetical protein HOK20_05280 [Alphaproteobacteria bacterium]|jgi:hypothetical protein|nr:hypothetical protein [Alphaproteobacteria bacterium]
MFCRYTLLVSVTILIFGWVHCESAYADVQKVPNFPKWGAAEIATCKKIKKFAEGECKARVTNVIKKMHTESMNALCKYISNGVKVTAKVTKKAHDKDEKASPIFEDSSEMIFKACKFSSSKEVYEAFYDFYCNVWSKLQNYESAEVSRRMQG